MKIQLLFMPVLLLTACSSIGSYEGMSAEEWFNEYDVIEAENEDLQAQISDLEYERDDLQSQLDDLESVHEEMIECITGGPNVYFPPIYTYEDMQRNFDIAIGVMQDNVACTK